MLPLPSGDWHGLVLGLDPLVVFRHLLRPRVVRPEALEDRGGGQAADRELLGAIQESRGG